jgi:hypothetical protein
VLVKTWLFVARTREQAVADAAQTINDVDRADCCGPLGLSDTVRGREYDGIRVRRDVSDAAVVVDVVVHHLKSGKYRIHYQEDEYTVVEIRQTL